MPYSGPTLGLGCITLSTPSNIVNATRFPSNANDYFYLASFPQWTSGQSIMIYLGINGTSANVPYALNVDLNWTSQIKIILNGTYISVDCQGTMIGNYDVAAGRASVLGVCVTFSSGTVRAYIWEVGVETPAQAGSGGTYTGNGGGWLCVGNDGYGDPFGWSDANTWLEYLYVWNQTLTLAQVISQSAQKAPLITPAHYWKLEGGSGTATTGTNLTVYGTPAAASTGVDIPETA